MELTKRSSYYYDLPEELIAQTPLLKRDEARLLVCNKETEEVEHKKFFDIIDYLNADDVLVINDTKVIPCRLIGHKDGSFGAVEVFLLKRIDLYTWEALVKPGKKLKIGAKIIFDDSLSCEVIDNTDFGGRIVKFSFKGVFEEILDHLGQMPLPPYIKTKLEDKNMYQTVYCKHIGSSAAPTAGLHFTEDLIRKIENKGVKIVRVLLHVGLGTFRPVKEDDITHHPMHSEYYEVSSEAADVINKAKSTGHRIIAVGTTSVRTLESANDGSKVVAKKGDTNIFIYPPYKMKIVDAIITNFHLPESTLIMLVSAYLGYENTMKMYKVAVEEKYRFFSFGDACYLY